MVFCSIKITGLSPLILSTSGLSKLPMKLRAYAEHRVPFVWLVEPLEKLVEVLELDGATYRIVQGVTGDDAVRLRPFEAIELPLAVLWQR